MKMNERKLELIYCSVLTQIDEMRKMRPQSKEVKNDLKVLRSIEKSLKQELNKRGKK